MSRRRGALKGILSQWQRFAKTIQVYDIQMSSAQTSNTQTLGTTVDKTKCFAIFLGHRSTQNTDASRYKVRVELTNNTTATVSRNTASSAAQTVNGAIVVIELYKWAVKNVDHGTVVITASTTAFVTPAFTPSVDKNTLCIYLGNTTNKTGDSSRLSGLHTEVAYTIGNNRVTATAAASFTYTTGYCLIEFNPGIIKSKNEALLAINASTTVMDVTQSITAVNTASTITFNGGERYTDGFHGIQIRGYLNSSTELKASGDVAYNFATRRVRVIAMEFYPQFVRRSFRGTVSFSGNPQDKDTSIGFTASNANRLMPNYIGFGMTNSFSNEDYCYQTNTIKDADEANSNRDSASGTATNIPTPSIEVFELR